MVGLERTKFLDPLRFSYTIHSAEISPVTAHSNAPSCKHTRTPLQQYTHHLCTHTHTHSPAHPFTHSYHTYTYTPLQQYTHHLCTPLHLLTNIYKYQAYNCQNAYLRISTNIHPCIPLQNIYKYPHYHTTVPII